MDRQAPLVPVARLGRWVENFSGRHGSTELSVVDGALDGRAEDGSTFRLHPPLSAAYAGPADVEAFARACTAPETWGVLLVRKGGFAVARLTGEETVASKTGQRHVQGRTKAGGQSQQRFARRRDNQARQAYEAAAEHAARVLDGVRTVVAGGDHDAVEAVLTDRRLAHVEVVGSWLPVPDPRRSVLEAAVADALSVPVEVVNA